LLQAPENVNIYVYARPLPVPEILRKNGFVVSIYFELGAKHHLPHCHVEWGEKEAILSLPMMTPLCGDEIPRRGRQLVAENITLLVESWEALIRQQEGSQKKKADRKPQAHRGSK
jgi:hypothetical protein